MARQSKAGKGLVLIFALIMILAVAAVLASRHISSPGRTADALVAGYQQQRTLDAQDAEDQDLTDDEEAAGALWARDHRPRTTLECPRYPEAFHKGCDDYLRVPTR